MAVRRIVPNIAAPDPLSRIGFYTYVLGLELVMKMDFIATFASRENPTAQLSLVKSDPALAHFSSPRIDPSRRVPDYTVEVDDIDACFERARARDCVIHYPLTTEEWGVRRFFVQDPHGMVVNVMQHEDGPAAYRRLLAKPLAR